MIRKLVFGIALLIGACTTTGHGSYLILDFKQASVTIFAVDMGSFRNVRFVGDAPTELTGKRASMTGAGSVIIGKNRIQFTPNEVKVNGKLVRSSAGGYSNYILSPDGRIERGFIRSFE